MSNAYRQAYTSFFKEHTTALSKGRFWLDEASDCTLGEPMQLHPTLTGYIDSPIKKRRIRSYENATPGVEDVIGVSLDIRSVSSGVSNDDIILRPDYYYPREITVMQIGICPIVNMASGYTTQINDKVVSANGGCMSENAPEASATFSLGKALQETIAQTPGLVWVNPQAEVL